MLEQQLKTAQKQTVTPAMLMGFSLLQLPVAELREAVQKELAANPALEPKGGFISSPKGAEEGYLENLADTRGETLEEHLASELRMSGLSPRQEKLAIAIAEHLNRDGRFTGTYADLRMVLLGEGITSIEDAEFDAARVLVMSLDPKGCGARDLAECYLAQLAAIPAAKRADAKRAIGELRKAIDENRLESFRPKDLKAFLLLKALDPYPGRLYEHSEVQMVVPDIHFEAVDDISVDLKDIPEIQVSAKYVAMAKDRELDEETRTFAAERVKRAREFEAALIRREETMEKIAEATLSRQADFLEKGTAGLHRLTMSEIAKAAKCTVSTVSRAAARKYVKTPRGVFPFRVFFPLVDHALLEKLRELIASAQRAKKPLSDRLLAEAMSKAGYPLARRTVAKYRSLVESKRK